MNLSPRENVFSLFLLGIASVVMFYGLPPTFRALQSYGFASTSAGRVTAVAAKQNEKSVDLTYEFEYEGRKYSGSRYNSYGLFYADSGPERQQFAHDHPVGAAITVYFDRTAPTNCTLTRGIDLTHIGIWVFFLFLLYCGMGVRIGWVRVTGTYTRSNPGYRADF